MLEVFYSYAHEDEALRDELDKHLSLLKRQGIISGWHDREITAGSEWQAAIDEHLESAQLILLLVSADFLASDYCYDVEMTRALQRHDRGEARVIPIILKPVDWDSAPFGRLQCLPKDALAVTAWANQDAAFADIAKVIRKAAQASSGNTAPLFLSSPQTTAPAPNPATPQPQPLAETISFKPKKQGTNEKRSLNVKWHWIALGIGLALITAFTLSLFFGDYREHLDKGRDYFQIGKFPDAKQEYQQALDIHPLYMLANTLGAVVNDNTGQLIKKYARALIKNTDAYTGLEKTQVFESQDPATIETKLKYLEQARPHDANVQLLWGWFYAGQGQLEQAEAHYQQAPDIAEAWFGLSYVYDLQGQFVKAKEAAQKAVKLSSTTPRYLINLANSYTQLKQYDEALQQLARVSDEVVFPKVERARIYRLTGDLAKAKPLLIDVVALLNRQETLQQPDNGEPWYFKTDRNAIILKTPVDKQYYALASLVAVLTLLHQNEQAQGYKAQLQALPAVQHTEIDELLDFDNK